MASRSGRGPGSSISGELAGGVGRWDQPPICSYGETEAQNRRRLPVIPSLFPAPPRGRPLTRSTHRPVSGPHAAPRYARDFWLGVKLLGRSGLARARGKQPGPAGGASCRGRLRVRPKAQREAGPRAEPQTSLHSRHGPEDGELARPTERPALLPITELLRQSRCASPSCRRWTSAQSQRRPPRGRIQQLKFPS